MDEYGQVNINYYSPEDLRNNLRLVWSQYSMWTRFLIISKAASINDQLYIINRLYEIPRDLNNIFQIYFDKDLAKQFEQLFRNNITLTIALVYVGLDKFSDKLSEIEWIWMDNAVSLADLLNKMNPYWEKDRFKNLLYSFLDMTVEEIEKRKNKNYASDIFSYDFIEYHVLMIADILWDGFIKKFY